MLLYNTPLSMLQTLDGLISIPLLIWLSHLPCDVILEANAFAIVHVVENELQSITTSLYHGEQELQSITKSCIIALIEHSRECGSELITEVSISGEAVHETLPLVCIFVCLATNLVLGKYVSRMSLYEVNIQ